MVMGVLLSESCSLPRLYSGRSTDATVFGMRMVIYEHELEKNRYSTTIEMTT